MSKDGRHERVRPSEHVADCGRGSKGRTPRQLAGIGIRVTFQCSDCEHVAGVASSPASAEALAKADARVQSMEGNVYTAPYFA